MENKKIKMHLKCLLSDNEKLEAGESLANATNELNEIEADKKRVNDDFKSRTSSAEAQVGILSNKLRSGYEYREVDCQIVFDSPEDGKKTIYRTDIDLNTIVQYPDANKVEVRDMTEEEILASSQHELPLNPEPEQEAE